LLVSINRAVIGARHQGARLINSDIYQETTILVLDVTSYSSVHDV